MPAAAAPQHRSAGPGGLAGAVSHSQDLARVDVDNARRDAHVGLGIRMADTADTIVSPIAAGASKVPFLGLIAELRDAANNNCVYPQHLADPGRAVGVGAVGVGEVLFGHDLVQRLALDHRERTVLHQTGHQQVDDALANIHIGAEHGGGSGLYRGVVEIHDGDPGPALCGGLGMQGNGQNSNQECKTCDAGGKMAIDFHRASS